MFIVLCVLSYVMCLAYNRGYPFKEPLSYNLYLMIFGFFVALISIGLLFPEIIENNFIG